MFYAHYDDMKYNIVTVHEMDNTPHQNIVRLHRNFHLDRFYFKNPFK